MGPRCWYLSKGLESGTFVLFAKETDSIGKELKIHYHCGEIFLLDTIIRHKTTVKGTMLSLANQYCLTLHWFGVVHSLCGVFKNTSLGTALSADTRQSHAMPTFPRPRPPHAPVHPCSAPCLWGFRVQESINLHSSCLIKIS